jgi:hypothetical protein
MTNLITQRLNMLAAEMGKSGPDLHEALNAHAHAASVQAFSFFALMIVLVFVWVRAYQAYSKSGTKSDLTSSVLFMTCLPLTISVIGSTLLVFSAVEWFYNPDSYILMLLKGDAFF